ncbi:hypothetical protein N7478_008704 [Penicillium angulare]|uniref:uncharacterized protein n=1 Tax=Penicillium angulare TaxID=116970 RepID=UPI0025421407|nr:uncharacterized protein N7478_008704 [Penicillium angulare]KAJ5273579.1 hypothetical protein N7478_008704 [Penicillium angulare]
MSDEEWSSILAEETDLLLAVVEANKRQHTHQARQLVLKRITVEMEAYNIDMQHPRKVLDRLLSEILRLRCGQKINTGHEDQLPVDTINVMPDDS